MINEAVSHENDFAPQMAEYAKSIDALHDPVTRRDYFENLTENDFLEMTQRVASILRTGDSEQLQHFDGDKVALMMHEVPDQREKEGLLRETWQTAQMLLHNRNLSDEDALEYAALTVAGGLLYAHPFMDGNGRTSRTLSYLIAKGGESEDELRAMTAGSSQTSWHVAPKAQLAMPNERTFGGDQPEEIEFEDELAGEATDAFGDVITNSMYSGAILRSVIERADDETKELVNQCSVTDKEGRRHLDATLFLKTLAASDRAGEYAQQLFSSYRELRADFVHRYLQGMLSETPIEQRIRGAGKYRELINEEIGKRAVGGLILRRDQAVAEHRVHSQAHHRS